jgi:hypothetical protein
MSRWVIPFVVDDWTLTTDRRYTMEFSGKWWQRKFLTPTVMLKSGDVLEQAGVEMRTSENSRTLTLTCDVPFSGEVWV